MISALWCLVVAILVVGVSASPKEHEYCVIGAGPAGLQIGYFLHKAQRDYVIFEKSSAAGNRFCIKFNIFSLKFLIETQFS